MLLFALLALGSSCRGPQRDSWSRHADSAMWLKGTGRFGQDPARWVPPAVLAVATPIVWISDKAISEESIEHSVFQTKTQYGDGLAVAYVAAPVLLGAWQAYDGDSRLLETSTEALGATLAVTYGLKLAINKQRPDGTSHDSFPSAHTSAAFAGATLFERVLAAEFDDPWWRWFVYLPATYVGISRLEGDRHYLSDILGGAALGMAISNIVWEAHVDEGRDERLQVHWAPFATGDAFGLGVDVSF